MNSASDTVAGQRGKLEQFSDETLAGKGRISMHQER